MNTATLITSTSPTRQSFRRLACVALFCILGTAQSWAGSSERSITVSFRDLDVSTLAGATTLYQRIQTAAKQVCSRSAGDPIEQMGWKACYRRATAEAVGKVNNPLLTAVHSGRTPEITAMLSK